MTDPNPGTVHTMEEEMRAAEQGVFEAKAIAGAPSNKARKAAPVNKTEVSMDLLKADLIKIARKEGVAIETDDNKADLVRKIEQARK